MRQGPDISNWQGEVIALTDGAEGYAPNPLTNTRLFAHFPDADVARFDPNVARSQLTAMSTVQQLTMPSVITTRLITGDVTCWVNEGKDVAIVRASLEDTPRYQLAQRQMDACLRGGVDLSVYGWVYWHWDPIDTAKRIIEQIGLRPCRYIWWDLEDEGRFVSRSHAIDWIMAAMEYCEGFGINTGVYTGEWFTYRVMGNDVGALATRPLWSASYTGAPFRNARVYSGWPQELLYAHQFSSTYGICGRELDMNGFADEYFSHPVYNGSTFEPPAAALTVEQRLDRLEYLEESDRNWLPELHEQSFDVLPPRITANAERITQLIDMMEAESRERRALESRIEALERR
jgi:hypothetical protein